MKYIFYVVFICLLIYIAFYWQNNILTKRNVIYKNKQIPKEWNGKKIVHLSDLHNKRFGKNQKRFIEMLKEEQPDLIVYSGDLIWRLGPDYEPVEEFLSQVTTIAPMYFVSGNHEHAKQEYPKVKNLLNQYGIINLDNTMVYLDKEKKLGLYGVADPDFFSKEDKKGYAIFEQTLTKLLKENPSECSILITHRPEIFDLYVKHNVSLVCSGHAHGGQVRLIFKDGLLAPHQGLFPKYTQGPYYKNNTCMNVSRGLGKSRGITRVCNKPEIITITLRNH